MHDKVRIPPLKTAIDCRRELARVYRQARRGEISTQDMGRFANLLQVMVGVIRDTDIESKVAELESARNPRRNLYSVSESTSRG